MFFFPQLVETRHSHFNGEIKVYKQFGRYNISVDNLTQSGGLLIPIWKRGLKVILHSQLSILNCLILGLGGGTAAQIVRQMWPDAHITSIEIDPIMITLAKKYGYTKNVNIINSDAFQKIYSLTTNHYSLILVDTYLGKSYPSAAKSLKTIRQLIKLLHKDGIIIFNRLNWGEYGQDTENQINLLKEHFPKVWSKKILSNTLVFCTNSR